MQQSMTPGVLQVFCRWEIHEHRKTAHGKFLDGYGQGTDILNKSVTQQ